MNRKHDGNKLHNGGKTDKFLEQKQTTETDSRKSR